MLPLMPVRSKARGYGCGRQGISLQLHAFPAQTTELTRSTRAQPMVGRRSAAEGGWDEVVQAARAGAGLAVPACRARFGAGADAPKPLGSDGGDEGWAA